ncbi:MAG: glycosyltransferase family 39 protein [Deltaproteobacteria bacterium]|nr:glycosyltransferase family 39 protein [Deltaproteobacteria bacterium]
MEKALLKLANSRVLFLIIMPIVLYVVFSPLMPLIEPDESRYFEISDNMVDSGDYVIPRLANVIYLEKPPLTYWASAIIFKFFGETDFTARIYVGLCAWACLLLTYGIGSFLRDRTTGLYAAGVLCTSLFFFIFGNFNILDIPLALYTCLATWAGYRHLVGTSKKKWLYLLYLSSALAFLTKGLIGVIFPLAILGVWLVFSGQWKRTMGLISPIGIVLFLAITAPWFILVQRAHQNFLWFFFIQEHLLRYTTTMHGRDNTFLLYVPVVILGILPWAAFLGKAAWEMHKGKIVSSTLQGSKFLWTWVILIFVFFSLSHSKLIPYIAPIFIPLSVLIGHKLRNYDDLTLHPRKQFQSFLLQIPILLQSLLLMTVFLLPIFLQVGSKFGGDLSIVYSRELSWLIILPIFSQLLLAFLPELVKTRYQCGWFVTIYFLSGLFLLSMTPSVSSFLIPYKSAYPASQAIKRILPAGHELYQYKIILYGIATYNEIRTPLVGDFGELSYGMKFLPKEERDHYFLTEEQFKARCDQEGTIYCLTEYREHFDELTRMFPNHEVLWSNGVYYLMKLKCQINDC